MNEIIQNYEPNGQRSHQIRDRVLGSLTRRNEGYGAMIEPTLNTLGD